MIYKVQIIETENGRRYQVWCGNRAVSMIYSKSSQAFKFAGALANGIKRRG